MHHHQYVKREVGGDEAEFSMFAVGDVLLRLVLDDIGRCKPRSRNLDSILFLTSPDLPVGVAYDMSWFTSCLDGDVFWVKAYLPQKRVQKKK